MFLFGFLAAAAALAVLRRWWPVLLLVVALVGELALFLTTAITVGRPRPPVAHADAALPPTSSFPSGHTCAAICLFGGIALIVGASTTAWWRWRDAWCVVPSGSSGITVLLPLSPCAAGSTW